MRGMPVCKLCGAEMFVNERQDGKRYRRRYFCPCVEWRGQKRLLAQARKAR